MFLKKFSRFITSKSIIWIISIAWIYVMAVSKPWEQNVIVNDIVSYYGYLPATFINKDITLKFAEGNPDYAQKFWPEKAPNGGKVIKTTLGVSILYAPFFFIGHAAAHILHSECDGYSVPYRICLLLSCLFYLIIGFHFLRKILLLYFTETITILTMVSVFFGTNLFWYATFDGLLSHAYLFTFVNIFIYLIIKWHASPKIKTAILIGLVGGLITLIRPTMILAFLIFFLYNVYNKESLLAKIKLLKSHFLSLIIIAVFSFLVILPQLLYWKYITGNYFFFSYVGERFYWDNPHIIKGLFGFRKGWLIYTPIMCFAVIGIFYLRKNIRSFFLPLLVLFPILVYVFFSWWAWWYGGSFGLRAFVDYYGLFAIPMACCYTKIFNSNKRTLKWIISILIFLLIYLNLFQTWQIRKHLLHYDSMTREAYFLGFRRTYNIEEWWAALEAPDYDRARKGLSEYCSPDEIKKIIPSDEICLKGFNQCLIGIEPESNSVRCASEHNGKFEKFSFVYLQNKVAIKAFNGKYLSVNPGPIGKLYAEGTSIGPRQLFELVYLPNGRIALKAFNNNYVTVDRNKPYELYARSKDYGQLERIRIYIN